jgi:DNA modification methylase
MDDLDELIASTMPPAEIVEDEPPEPPEEPVTVRGDVWELGRHRLMCGDSTVKDDVEKLMGGVKADMVFTDPPYGVDYSSRVDKDKHKPWGGIKNDDLGGNELHAFLSDALSWIVCDKYICCNWQSVVDFFTAIGRPNALIVWDKCSIGLGAGYRNQHEFILFYGKLDHNSETNMWQIKRESTSAYCHPTQKPVEVPARAISNSSKNGHVVLDVFGGSGSTLVACEQLGRTNYTMELDERYVDVIIQRYVNFTGNREIKRNGEPYTWEDKKD